MATGGYLFGNIQQVPIQVSPTITDVAWIHAYSIPDSPTHTEEIYRDYHEHPTEQLSGTGQKSRTSVRQMTTDSTVDAETPSSVSVECFILTRPMRVLRMTMLLD